MKVSLMEKESSVPSSLGSKDDGANNANDSNDANDANDMSTEIEEDTKMECNDATLTAVTERTTTAFSRLIQSGDENAAWIKDISSPVEDNSIKSKLPEAEPVFKPSRRTFGRYRGGGSKIAVSTQGGLSTILPPVPAFRNVTLSPLKSFEESESDNDDHSSTHKSKEDASVGFRTTNDSDNDSDMEEKTNHNSQTTRVSMETAQEDVQNRDGDDSDDDMVVESSGEEDNGENNTKDNNQDSDENKQRSPPEPAEKEDTSDFEEKEQGDEPVNKNDEMQETDQNPKDTEDFTLGEVSVAKELGQSESTSKKRSSASLLDTSTLYTSVDQLFLAVTDLNDVRVKDIVQSLEVKHECSLNKAQKRAVRQRLTALIAGTARPLQDNHDDEIDCESEKEEDQAFSEEEEQPASDDDEEEDEAYTQRKNLRGSKGKKATKANKRTKPSSAEKIKKLPARKMSKQAKKKLDAARKQAELLRQRRLDELRVRNEEMQALQEDESRAERIAAKLDTNTDQHLKQRLEQRVQLVEKLTEKRISVIAAAAIDPEEESDSDSSSDESEIEVVGLKSKPLFDVQKRNHALGLLDLADRGARLPVKIQSPKITGRAVLQRRLKTQQRYTGNQWLARELGYQNFHEHVRDCKTQEEQKRRNCLLQEQVVMLQCQTQLRNQLARGESASSDDEDEEPGLETKEEEQKEDPEVDEEMELAKQMGQELSSKLREDDTDGPHLAEESSKPTGDDTDGPNLGEEPSRPTGDDTDGPHLAEESSKPTGDDTDGPNLAEEPSNPTGDDTDGPNLAEEPSKPTGADKESAEEASQQIKDHGQSQPKDNIETQTLYQVSSALPGRMSSSGSQKDSLGLNGQEKEPIAIHQLETQPPPKVLLQLMNQGVCKDVGEDDDKDFDASETNDAHEDGNERDENETNDMDEGKKECDGSNIETQPPPMVALPHNGKGKEEERTKEKRDPKNEHAGANDDDQDGDAASIDAKAENKVHEKMKPSGPRNQGWKAMLQADAARARKQKQRKAHNGGLVEEEADEEEEDGIAGLEDFGFAVKKKDVEEEEDFDGIHKDDLEGVVDDLSDDEGDEEAGEAARKEMEAKEEKERRKAMLRTLREGYDGRRGGVASGAGTRGVYRFDQLVAADNRENAKRLGLLNDDELDSEDEGENKEKKKDGEEEEEDEALLVDKILRERFLHRASEAELEEHFSEDEDDQGEGNKGLAKNREDKEEEEEERMAKRFAKRARMHRLIEQYGEDEEFSQVRLMDEDESLKFELQNMKNGLIRKRSHSASLQSSTASNLSFPTSKRSRSSDLPAGPSVLSDGNSALGLALQASRRSKPRLVTSWRSSEAAVFRKVSAAPVMAGFSTASRSQSGSNRDNTRTNSSLPGTRHPAAKTMSTSSSLWSRVIAKKR